MTVTDEEVEAAAIALRKTIFGGKPPRGWEAVLEHDRNGYRKQARAALTAAARVRAGNVQKTEG